jgi:excisionase family DNA binding protein
LTGGTQIDAARSDDRKWNCDQFRLARRFAVSHTCGMITSMPDINLDLLYTVREAAGELRLAASTVASMVSRGTLETIDTRFGRLITKDSVDSYRTKSLGKPGRKSRS